MKPTMAHDGPNGFEQKGEGGFRECHGKDDRGGTVSLRAEVPEHLLQAMGQFIERHPNWDQYRLFQAALAGFLVQNGVQNRGVTRCYLANLFPGAGGFDPLPGGAERSAPTPLPRRFDPRAERPWAGDHPHGSQHHAA
jgi:hypothetical protein